MYMEVIEMSHLPKLHVAERIRLRSVTQCTEAVHVENEAPSRIPEPNARSNAGLRLIDDLVHPVAECL